MRVTPQPAALHAEAVRLQNSGHPRQALRLLTRALAAVPAADAALTTALLISAALNEAEVSGAPAGLAAIDAALERAQATGDPALIVRAYSQRALIALRAGRHDLSRASLDAAEPLLPAADDNDQFAVLLNAGAMALFEQRLRDARRRLERAVTVARRAGMVDGEFKALHNLAYAQFLAGDLPTALRLMDEAGALDATVSRGIWHMDRARVLAEAGLVHESDAALAQAAEIFRHDRLAQDLAEAEVERARCALLADNPEQARRFAMRARERFRRRGNDRWRRRAELVLLGADLAAGRPGSRLLSPALRLRDELVHEDSRHGARTAALIAAEAALAARRPETAAAILGQAGRSSRADPTPARLHDAYVRAALDAARSRRGAAFRRADSALEELARFQAGFGSTDLASAAAVHGRRIAALNLQLALETGRAERVLDASERARAVTNRLIAVRPPADPVTAELLAQLRQVLESLRASDDPELQRRRRDLEARVAARDWARRGSAALRRPVQLADLAEALGDLRLVSFVRSHGRLHAVAIDGGRAEIIALGGADPVEESLRRVRADLDVLAQPTLPGVVRRAVAASMQQCLGSLERELLAPLGSAGQPLVIATSGLLGRVPWNLLPSLRGTPVAVAPSATAWHTASTATGTGRRRVVAVAGPGLARGASEADSVAKIWDADALTVGDATTAAVGEALTSARLVHIAAHGAHQVENPLFSCLRLADGALFAYDLDVGTGTADHVVLSACELGLATVRPGDEALGLTSVLLRAGSRSVVAGLARVNDETAAAVMEGYHERLAGGWNSAAALAATVADVPVDGPPAPFACFGAAWRAAERPAEAVCVTG